MNDNDKKFRIALFAVLIAWCIGADANELPPLDCVIEPYEVIEVSSAAEGVIERVHVERNELVTRGQVLAELESDVEKASLAYAQFNASLVSEIKLRRTSLDFDERNNERLEELFTKKAIPLHHKDEAETDAAKSRWLLTKAEDDKRLAALEYTRAGAVLKRKTVRSPISGVVVARHKSTGEYIEDQAIVTVAQLHPLRVEVIAPVELFGAVSSGMLGDVVPELATTGPLRAKVTSVDRFVDGASGTFDIRLELPNPDYAIPSGLKCQVTFSDATDADDVDLPMESIEPAPPPADFGSDRAGQREASTTPDDHEVDAPIGEPGIARIEPAVPEGSPALVEEAATEGGISETAPTSEPEPVKVDISGTMEPAETVTPLTDAPPAQESNAPVIIADDDSRLHCGVIGPLADNAEAKRIAAAFDHLDVASRVIETREDVVHSYVLATPKTGDPAARQAIDQRIAEHGISDTASLYKGSLKDRYSFGVFNNKTVATVRQRELKTLGFDIELVPRTRQEARFMLEVVTSGDESTETQLRLAVTEAGISTRLQFSACEGADPAFEPSTATIAAAPE